VVPGNWNKQSGYHSELAGISSLLTIAAAIYRIHNIQEGSINDAAGDWSLSPEHPNFDLIMDISVKIKKLPICVKWKWVEGHQDDDKSLTLDEWAKANIMTDNMAKAF
jgi:hypothetical protein